MTTESVRLWPESDALTDWSGELRSHRMACYAYMLYMALSGVWTRVRSYRYQTASDGMEDRERRDDSDAALGCVGSGRGTHGRTGCDSCLFTPFIIGDNGCESEQWLKNVIIGWEESAGNSGVGLTLLVCVSAWVERMTEDWGMRCLCWALASNVSDYGNALCVWVSAESAVNRTNPSATDVRDDDREREANKAVYCCVHSVLVWLSLCRCLNTCSSSSLVFSRCCGQTVRSSTLSKTVPTIFI